MKQLLRGIVVLVLGLAGAVGASEAEARRILQAWNLRMETWELELRAAATPEERAKVMAARPNVQTAATEMWRAIGNSLDREWVVEPAAWFLRAAPGLLLTTEDGGTMAAFSREIEAVRKAVETHHVKSPKLVPMCMALVTNQDPRSLSILEKIIAENPSAEVRGVAALAASMVLKGLGDDAEVMRKRIGHLREAIIHSDKVDLGGTTVADVAKDELFIINHLTKGRIAPELSGFDSAARPMKLSDFRGQVVLLLFWSQSMPEAEATMRMMRETAEGFAGRPFVLIGVNQDATPVLRGLEADRAATWRSFSDSDGKLAAEYRIGSLPAVMVLDGEGRIHYTGPPGSFAELTAEALLPEADDGK